MKVNSALDAVLVARHYAGLSTDSLANNEREVRVGLLDLLVVVENVVSCALGCCTLLA